MSETGLQSLVKPSSEEQQAVECLCKHLEYLSCHGDVNGDSNFLSETRLFLNQLLTSCCGTVPVSGWSPCVQSFIVTVSETLYVVLCCLVCKKATDDVIVVPSRFKIQLRELIFRTFQVQKIVLSMQENMKEIMETKGSQSVVHVRNSQRLARQSQHAMDMLEGCHVVLAVILEAVESKCSFEVKFFNTASVTVGAISAGRCLWSLWQGDGFEDMVHAGVWSMCMGFTAAVLQVPRVRVTDIQTQLARHKKIRKKIKQLSAKWHNVNDWSYAKFVRFSSPRNGARL